MNFFNLNGLGIGGSSISSYRPLINYTWSSTYQANNQMYSANSGTGTYLQLYSGQGVKFNGVDQRLESIETSSPLSDVGTLIMTVAPSQDFTVDRYLLTNSSGNDRFYIRMDADEINLGIGDSSSILTGITQDETIQVLALSWNNGNYFISYGEQTNGGTYFGSPSGVFSITLGSTERYTPSYFDGTLKDLFIFNRTLTQTENAKYSANPNGFFNDALVDDTCVLNMPLAEHSTDCYDYANDTWHTIANYTDSCRDEAKQLPYGSQNANYKINGLGMRTEESPYLECSELFDNYGDTGWIPSADEDWSIEVVYFTPDPSIYTSPEKGIIGNDMQTASNRFWFYIGSGGNPIVFIADKYEVILGIEGWHHIGIQYSADAKTFTVISDDVLEGTHIIPSFMGGIEPLEIGRIAPLGEPSAYPIRLFKVHNKALTQEEVTTAYNKALQKGLLV